jgi:hypothetical protein
LVADPLKTRSGAACPVAGRAVARSIRRRRNRRAVKSAAEGEIFCPVPALSHGKSALQSFFIKPN